MYFIMEHAQITVEISCLFVGYIYIYMNQKQSENCDWKFTLATCAKRRTFIAPHFSKDAVNFLQLFENGDFFLNRNDRTQCEHAERPERMWGFC